MEMFTIKDNPNKEELSLIEEAIKLNNGYCPCASEKNDSTTCICEAFTNSEDTDFCQCGRFYKVENYEVLTVIGDVAFSEGAESLFYWNEILIDQHFLVMSIPLNSLSIAANSQTSINQCRAAIEKSIAVLILEYDDHLQPTIDAVMDWSERLGKKILRKGELLK